MPYSLRVKIKKLRYKEIITDKECDRLCKALDNEGVLDKIRAEIEKAIREDILPLQDEAGEITDEIRIPLLNPDDVFEIIDKYKAESEGKEEKR